MSVAAANAHHGPALRWWILAFISLALFGNYYVYDSIAPVADLLQQGLGFSDTDIGWLNAVYSVPNIFLVLVGGMLADRFGAALVSCVTAGMCLLGYSGSSFANVGEQYMLPSIIAVVLGGTPLSGMRCGAIAE